MADHTISARISIPTDEEGFILLKCPICGQLFKLVLEDMQDEGVFQIYCPTCGLVSKDYLSDDVIELAKRKAQNCGIDLIMSAFKELEKSSSKTLKFKVTHKPEKSYEPPIVSGVENLVKVYYPCCKKQAKIKPLLKICGSYCPYCGVKCDGTN